MCIYYLWHLEAVLDQVVVLPAGGSGLGVILQQDEELLCQLVGVLLHRRQRELEQPSERHQSLCDHLGREEGQGEEGEGEGGWSCNLFHFIYLRDQNGFDPGAIKGTPCPHKAQVP